jgi:PleD family two-component response regulator
MTSAILLLKEVALPSAESCVPRESDTVSRLGGDEFVILLAQIDKAADAVVVAGKILAALQAAVLAIGPHVIKAFRPASASPSIRSTVRTSMPCS